MFICIWFLILTIIYITNQPSFCLYYFNSSFSFSSCFHSKRIYNQLLYKVVYILKKIFICELNCLINFFFFLFCFECTMCRIPQLKPIFFFFFLPLLLNHTQNNFPFLFFFSLFILLFFFFYFLLKEKK